MSIIVPETTLLAYGAPGVGKSSLGALLIAHAYKHWGGLKARIIGADGGGTKPFKPLVDAGVAEYWPIDTWEERSAFELLDLASKGWWPADPSTPNSDLLPPTKEWRECPMCKGDSGAKGAAMPSACAACKKPFGAGIRLPKQMSLINGMESIGVMVFEGLTSYGNILMGRLKKADPTGGRSINDNGYVVAASGMQHYGDAQGYLQAYVANSRKLPIKAVMWTALELRGNDEFGKPVYGPKLPGKAMTEVCSAWFTDVWHVEAEPKMSGGKPVRGPDGREEVERKLYLAKHYPLDAAPYGFVAKTSAPLDGAMPLVLDYKSGENVVTRYYECLERAYKEAGKRLLS